MLAVNAFPGAPKPTEPNSRTDGAGATADTSSGKSAPETANTTSAEQTSDAGFSEALSSQLNTPLAAGLSENLGVAVQPEPTLSELIAAAGETAKTPNKPVPEYAVAAIENSASGTVPGSTAPVLADTPSIPMQVRAPNGQTTDQAAPSSSNSNTQPAASVASASMLPDDEPAPALQPKNQASSTVLATGPVVASPANTEPGVVQPVPAGANTGIQAPMSEEPAPSGTKPVEQLNRAAAEPNAQNSVPATSDSKNASVLPTVAEPAEQPVVPVASPAGQEIAAASTVAAPRAATVPGAGRPARPVDAGQPSAEKTKAPSTPENLGLTEQNVQPPPIRPALSGTSDAHGNNGSSGGGNAALLNSAGTSGTAEANKGAAATPATSSAPPTVVPATPQIADTSQETQLTGIRGTSGTSAEPMIATTAGTDPARAATEVAQTRVPQSPASPPVREIAMQISQHLDTGNSRFQIRLDPPELGRVEVRMEISAAGRLTAVIAAERPETLDLLQRDSRALERSLQDTGLKTDSDSLNFSLKGGKHDGRHADNSGTGAGEQTEPEADEWDLPLDGMNLSQRFGDRAVNIQI